MAERPAARRVGMILGKFMPPHRGHEYLIRFARNYVDELHVLTCSLPSEPIPGELRYRWMRELFPDCRVVHVAQALPQEPSEHRQFWDIWRETVRQAVGRPVDYVFASEEYGWRLAAELNAQFVPVDVDRSQAPISGAQVRQDPLSNWEFLPDCVRPYFVRRVCLFGPESTGKSTLAANLASRYRTVWVPEFARDWLDPKGGQCAADDIEVIARGQLASEDALARHANRLLFCDTDLLLTTIWSDVLFGQCPGWIEALARQRRYQLYLLLNVDVPWVDDAQRFLPRGRQEFFDRCESLLRAEQRPYVVVSGSWQQRLEIATDAIREHLGIEVPAVSPA